MIFTTPTRFDGRFTVIAGTAGVGWRDVCDELSISGIPIAANRVGIDLHDIDGTLAAAYELGSTAAC